MARLARRDVINPAEIQILHCVQRCVRRAFLCGEDAVTGKSFEHRKGWIRSRLEFLASAFGIDCLTYAVLSNHIHVVLRSRPDVVASWSNEEIAQRWLRLFPHRRDRNGDPEEPNEPEINTIVNDPDRLPPATRLDRSSDSHRPARFDSC